MAPCIHLIAKNCPWQGGEHLEHPPSHTAAPEHHRGVATVPARDELARRGASASEVGTEAD